MPETKTTYEHIVLDDDGVARIVGTRWKVSLLVAARQADGSSPEEFVYQHAGLTLGQVYSALAYYADHEPQIDAEIRAGLAASEDARQRAGASPLLQKLRARRLRQ